MYGKTDEQQKKLRRELQDAEYDADRLRDQLQREREQRQDELETRTNEMRERYRAAECESDDFNDSLERGIARMKREDDDPKDELHNFWQTEIANWEFAQAEWLKQTNALNQARELLLRQLESLEEEARINTALVLEERGCEAEAKAFRDNDTSYFVNW